MAEAHPDFADRPPPREAVLGEVRLAPLGPDCAAEDFAAVTASATMLAGLFGSAWPAGLTYEANLRDLIWHGREFDHGRSFAWAIRSEAGAYLGCAYVYPAMGARGRGRAFLWLAEPDAMPGRLAQITERFAAWLETQGLSRTDYPLTVPDQAACGRR